MKRATWSLNQQETNFFKEIALQKKKQGKPQVLWGWKRDWVEDKKRYPESRTVIFSADLGLDNHQTLFIKRAYFFLESRARTQEIKELVNTVGRSRNLSGYRMKVRYWQDYYNRGYHHLRIQIGQPTGYDLKTVKRRLKGKPRQSIKPIKLIPSATNFDISKHTYICLYAGSGLSAESGLPLLGTIHDVFGVDDQQKGRLIFGSEDKLPQRLIKDVKREFAKYCQFNVDALKAKPSESHFLLQKLWQKKIIKQVFTDNVDDIFQKIKVPYTQTRLSIFPDRYPVTFHRGIKSLLVIGVSVDRREVIKQARRKGLKIIVINPVMGVAPYSRNIDYLYKGDLFFKGKAENILPKIIKYSRF